MPLTIPANPGVPVLGSATFDTDAGANLAWQADFSAAMALQKVLIQGDFATGSNANGLWLDIPTSLGTTLRVQWRTWTVSAVACTTAQGSQFYGTLPAVNFPATFSGFPMVIADAHFAANQGGRLARNGSPSATSPFANGGTVRIYSPSSVASDDVRINYIAIGFKP